MQEQTNSCKNIFRELTGLITKVEKRINENGLIYHLFYVGSELHWYAIHINSRPELYLKEDDYKLIKFNFSKKELERVFNFKLINTYILDKSDKVIEI